ncbi:hypothetical protein POM88_018130 [Heracleum sosnowskyi]|uniref:Peptidase A1 domain-containing protein n=1 Tax=Heracleum sosnowskyi TaxID=360622 RepID=A0AAD8IT43_9APIA|nr:hypothetical protein POM88_018130 [Heracleum sosnowskyi]
MATTPYLLSIFLLSLSLADANIKTSRGVTLQLVHRFSPSLSFHKSDNFENFLERNDEYVIKRIAMFQQESIDAQLITPTSRHEHLFFVNLSIGEPPVIQYLAMDTGSRLIWVIGDSLKREFKYSPRSSSTSSFVSCGSDICKKISNSRCNSSICTCLTRYGDGHELESYMLYDRFLFENATVDKVIMGVHYRGSGGLFGEDNFYGVFGLGPRYPSIVHRLHDLGANKFSYYINGKVTDNFHPYAGLTLGDADVQGGSTTPLLIDDAQYLISLETISLGEECLPIDPKVFAKIENVGGTGVVIDSGSVKTWVAETAYHKVDSRISDALDKRGFDRRDKYCYFGTIEEVQKSNFPILSFNFAGGADLHLDEDDLFMDYPLLNYFCLTVRSSAVLGPTFENLTIIGLTAQQDYVMGYDLENLRLSMKLSDL